MPKAKFPKRLYVSVESADDDEFFNATRSPEDFAEECELAIYRLVEVKKLTIKKKLK